MKIFLPILLATLLCGCAEPDHVSATEFKKQFAIVGQPETMHTSTYLGLRDGRAFIRVSSMSTISQKKWSDRVIYVELSELDPTFRDSLPKTQTDVAR